MGRASLTASAWRANLDKYQGHKYQEVSETDYLTFAYLLDWRYSMRMSRVARIKHNRD